MSKSGAFPLHLLGMGLNVIYIVLSVFKRWSGDKDKMDEELGRGDQLLNPGGMERSGEGINFRYISLVIEVKQDC